MEAVLRESTLEEEPKDMHMGKTLDSELGNELPQDLGGTMPQQDDLYTEAKETNLDANQDEADTFEADDAEEVAIANAISSASASYVPLDTALNDSTTHALLASIDGPSLASYDRNTSTYTARNIPIAVRSKLTVPIYVANSGSIVEYALESQYYDLGFGIVAEREDGSTTVIELSRVDSNVAPITGRFLVLSVPCALVFTFDNEYSWFREKVC